MATHKETMEVIRSFVEYSRKYREKKKDGKTTLKDDALWLQKCNEMSKIISEYDVSKINYGKKDGKKVS